MRSGPNRRNGLILPRRSRCRSSRTRRWTRWAPRPRPPGHRILTAEPVSPRLVRPPCCAYSSTIEESAMTVALLRTAPPSMSHDRRPLPDDDRLRSEAHAWRRTRRDRGPTGDPRTWRCTGSSSRPVPRSRRRHGCWPSAPAWPSSSATTTARWLPGSAWPSPAGATAATTCAAAPGAVAAAASPTTTCAAGTPTAATCDPSWTRPSAAPLNAGSSAGRSRPACCSGPWNEKAGYCAAPSSGDAATCAGGPSRDCSAPSHTRDRRARCGASRARTSSSPQSTRVVATCPCSVGGAPSASTSTERPQPGPRRFPAVPAALAVPAVE